MKRTTIIKRKRKGTGKYFAACAFVVFALLLMLLSGCSKVSGYFVDNSCLENQAIKQELKLKQYFANGRKGANGTDVSTLISETRAISAKLKAAGLNERANKFDSYIDVLSYGNRTIDESIRDTQNLVKTDPHENKSTVCKYLDKWF